MSRILAGITGDGFPTVKEPPHLTPEELEQVWERHSQSSLGRSIAGLVPLHKLKEYSRKGASVMTQPLTRLPVRQEIRMILKENPPEKAISILFLRRREMSPVCLTRALVNRIILRLLRTLMVADPVRSQGLCTIR